ncbi:MAG: hypothetical protein KDK51_08975, partial [Deltaproteobacteria bacterium]|nr:hypothetical protein [Deltaproteobacteria bacterium]
TTGGNALKFYSSVRLDIRRIGAIKNGEEVIGNRTQVKVVKNKMAAPFKRVEFDIYYGQGISRVTDLLDLAVSHDIVEKMGSWYSFDGERLGQGKEKVRTYLEENPKVLKSIVEKVYASAGLQPPTKKVSATAKQTDASEDTTTKTKK